MHVSQSFSGSGAVSGVVVCYVTCPHDLVLGVQQAVDAAVCDALKERGKTYDDSIIKTGLRIPAASPSLPLARRQAPKAANR